MGWGGLADAFDPGKDSWAKEYAELKGLLSEDEYAAARSSTLNAHYTSPVVIRSIYDAVEKMGFRSGNILEPSMGVGNFFGGSLNKLAGGVGQVSVAVTSQAFRNYSYSLVSFFDGFTGKLRLGTLLFSYGFLTYVAIILAVAIWFFLSKTRTGLSLRAVGENTATADAAGINVTKYKYLATCIGAGISGLGGTYYVMNYIKGTWENQGTIEALGWLAVALVIFATWKSLRAIWGSYLFGVLYWAYNYIPGLSRSTLELFKMLPYVVTILVLLMVSMRKKKEDQPPQSLGIPYFREER